MPEFNHQQDDTSGLVRSLISLAALAAAVVALSWCAAHSEEVKLRWNPNPETDIACYTVYWGTQSGRYPDTAEVLDTRYTIENLTPGTTYYFAVQAVNTAGVTSEMSDEISYQIPLSPPPPKVTMKLMELESSEDLVEWQKFIYLPVDPTTPTSLFIRARIIEVTVP